MTDGPRLSIAGYLRVSTRRQGASGVGIEAQRDAIARWASGLPGSPDVSVWIVEEASGRDLHRDKLDCAIANLSQGDVLAIYAPDRLTRRVAHLHPLMERIAAHGGRVATASAQADYATAEGRFLWNLLIALAEREVMIDDERAANTEVFMKAGRYKRGTVPYGKRVHPDDVDSKSMRRLVDDEAEQVVVCRIGVLRTRCRLSFGQIAELLGREGQPTRGGAPWSRETVRKIYQRTLAERGECRS